MKKLALLCMAALGFSLMSCETEPATNPTDEKAPTVALEKGLEDVNAVYFTLTTTNATEARYMVLEDGADVPALATIMAEGVAVELEDGKAEVKAEGLEAETEYMVVAAAKNVTKMAGSNTLYVKTTAQAQLALSVELVQVTHESINFRFTATNADRIAYLVQNASKEAPEVADVLRKGDEVDPNSKEAVEVKDLDAVKEYVLYVAAEGAGQTLMAEPIAFTTKDDPSNVIEHNYTRVRGSKYSSNYYLMFSYEDANEADNFAYNDTTLCLDFYGDPAKDYLPAGTYEVKESTEWPCLSNMRYSTYGYDNGVQLKSGVAEVSIDPETKAYTFEISLQLKDGRSLVAHYTGDVDNMPVVDKVFVTTKYTSAKATTADNGVNWALTLADDAGNKAKLNLANAFKAPYIVNNTYTISTSAEEFSAKTMAAEAGQFDSTTSTFVVAGANGGEFKFATGTLTVDIDWVNKRYLLSFYGTLENGYIIESDYTGVIEGCNLEQSDEVVDVVMTRAYASSYESGANWYITLSQEEGELTNYLLKLDVYGKPSQFLAAGVYELGVGTGEGYLGIDATTLTVAGQGQYNFTEARLTVETNLADKTYSMVVSAKVQDGRTFLMSYVGKVDGMEIVNTDDTPTDLVWDTFTTKKWYSDNWQLTIKDSTQQYVMAFDMRTGDSNADYIPTNVYTLGESYVDTVYVDNVYSEFNGNKRAYESVTLDVVYDESSKTYNISFDVKLVDGREFSGAVSGSPAV